MTSPDRADVCLLLEGTYPYVRGGVSTWVHQLIEGLPDVTFSLLYIGSERASALQKRYDIPENVIALEELFLFDPPPKEELTPLHLDKRSRRILYENMIDFYASPDAHTRMETFWPLLDTLERVRDHVTFGNLCHDTEPWEMLVQAYELHMPEYSFIDFFWTMRFLHMPVWILLRSLDRIPPARVYHAPSAGYAGLVGAAAARRARAPFFLTEHGIYTKERILEITQADWIYEPPKRYFDYSVNTRRLKDAWIGLFHFLGEIAYHRAETIVSIQRANTSLQVEFGAPEEKIQIIPNGIDPARFTAAREERIQRRREDPARQIAGFIGRVVPIKDVKTLLRAASLLAPAHPGARIKIFGPTEEDPEYYGECRDLVRGLGLEEIVTFMGSRKIEDILPEIDVMVLTSLSESLPLVILEAYAAEVPVIATDVGACRELLFGSSAVDKTIGRGGLLTATSSPMETADALSTLLGDRAMQERLGKAGRKRVETFFLQTDILQRYRRIYHELGETYDKRNHLKTPLPIWQA